MSKLLSELRPKYLFVNHTDYPTELFDRLFAEERVVRHQTSVEIKYFKPSDDTHMAFQSRYRRMNFTGCYVKFDFNRADTICISKPSVVQKRMGEGDPLNALLIADGQIPMELMLQILIKARTFRYDGNHTYTDDYGDECRKVHTALEAGCGGNLAAKFHPRLEKRTPEQILAQRQLCNAWIAYETEHKSVAAHVNKRQDGNRNASFSFQNATKFHRWASSAWSRDNKLLEDKFVDARDMLVRMLTERGHEVDSAGDLPPGASHCWSCSRHVQSLVATMNPDYVGHQRLNLICEECKAKEAAENPKYSLWEADMIEALADRMHNGSTTQILKLMAARLRENCPVNTKSVGGE